MSRRKNHISKNLKDYFVPIIGILLVLLLLVSLFRWSDATDTSTSSQNSLVTPMSVVWDTTDDEVYIVYPGDKKEKIEGSRDVYIGEKITVKSGSASINFPTVQEMKLNKLGEIRYTSPDSFAIFSGEAFVRNTAPLNVSMKFLELFASENATFFVNQNEVGSTVYMLNGTATVKTNAGVETILPAQKKITILTKDALKEDVDISLLKEDIDSYFQSSDFFLKNNGALYTKTEEIAEVESLEEWEETSATSAWNAYIALSGITDESEITTSNIDVAGSILDQRVAGISLNGVSMSLVDGKFSLPNYALSGKETDLVFKVYDAENYLMDKFVYTLYSTANFAGTPGVAASTTTVQNTTVSSAVSADLSSVDATQFSFTAPSSTGKFVTDGDEITIRWITTAKDISKVTVNGYTLKSFNGSTWRFHAFKRFEQLAVGTNRYEVQYFGKDGSLVYTDYYTIVKKDIAADTEAKTISGEVTPN